MAFVEGYPGEKIKGTTIRHWGFLVIVAVMLVGLMSYFSSDWKAELPSTLFTVSIILAIVLFVSHKVNPLGWKKILQRTSFERTLTQDRMIADRLAELDDSHFIFHDITFELFHVEHLVISPRGIFVIATVRRNEKLTIQKNSLFAGDDPLDKVTGNLWRVCHLVNIVIRKGFSEEVMPKPLLVSPEAESVDVGEFDGIAVMTLDRMNASIENRKEGSIPQKLVESFAYYIKKRYT